MNACPGSDVIESLLSGELVREERSRVVAHLRSCGECRREALRLDPTVVFRLAASREAHVSDEESRAILENVRAAISLREASRKLERMPSHAWGVRRAAAALAGAVLLSLTASSPMVRRHPASASIPTQRRPAPPASFARAVAPDRSDEALAPATATVYEWNPGENSPDDPKIVWIVDRSLDL